MRLMDLDDDIPASLHRRQCDAATAVAHRTPPRRSERRTATTSARAHTWPRETTTHSTRVFSKFEDGRQLEKTPDRFGLALQDLFHQVVDDVAVANVCSRPSAVMRRCAQNPPTLFTSTSRRGSVFAAVPDAAYRRPRKSGAPVMEVTSAAPTP